jgi:hypothetical protein
VKTVSQQEKLEKVRSLTDRDLTDWERRFMGTVETMALKGNLSKLSDRQWDIVENMYEKHFCYR